MRNYFQYIVAILFFISPLQEKNFAQQNNWETLSISKLRKYEAQSAVVGDLLYVFTGFTYGLEVTDTTEIYDYKKDSWSLGAPILYPVTHNGLIVVGNEIWSIGGFSGKHPGFAISKIQIYNTETDSWRLGPELPEAWASGAAVLLNNKLYVFGGLEADRNTDVAKNIMLDLDNISLGWTELSDLPNPRNHLSGAALDGLIYAIGGHYRHDIRPVEELGLVHAYDPSTNEWIQKASLPNIKSHAESSTFVYRDKIYVIGGRNKGKFYNTIDVYDSQKDSWIVIDELPEKILAPVAKVIDDRLIVSNGSVERYDNPTDLVYSKKMSDVIGYEIDKVLLFPNPIDHTLFMEFDTFNEGSTISILISNVSNSLLIEESIESLNTGISYPLDVEELSSGIYFLKVCEGSNCINRKILKR